MSDVVLASGSVIRARVLEAAGVSFAVDPTATDEASVKSAHRFAGATPAAVARILADTKALAGSEARPGAYVVGGDQVLVCEGEWFDKPADREAARRQLLRLRGRRHDLYCAASVARGGDVLWRHSAVATLAMRPFSDGFLDSYLDRAGDGALRSVGCYEIEGLGAQLFSEVAGDHFSILGLPLLPLLGFLRGQGLLAA